MTLQGKLYDYELQLLGGEIGDHGWTKSGWPSEGHGEVGMKLERLHRPMGKDRLMLHRFWPASGNGALHVHPYILAAHVLGPGIYEVGFGLKDVLQSRVVSAGSYYYEMLTRNIQHYVLPKGPEPVHTVAIWVPFSGNQLPPPVAMDGLADVDSMRSVVEGFFERLWGSE